MLNSPSADDLLKGASNRYELVIAVSKRARQLQDGDEALVDEKGENSKVTIASLEFDAEKVKILNEENGESNE